jgi:mannonate dehydratase
MHLTLTLDPFSDSDLLYAQQLGVDWIIGKVPSWDTETLAAAQNRARHSGSHLCALDVLPRALVAAATARGERQEQAIAEIARIVADAGSLGIPSVLYRLPAAGSGASSRAATGRGGASGMAYSLADSLSAPLRVDEERQDGFADFLQRVTRAAEAAGVRMVLHPGVSAEPGAAGGHVFASIAELDSLLELAGSTLHGLVLDHGWASMALSTPLPEVIRHFGSRKRIVVAEIRYLRAVAGGAEEHFLDEDRAGLLWAMQAYRSVGFDGALCPFPAPAMTDDTGWRHKGHAFDIGYLRGILQVIGQQV